jgi:hypothetical protein
MRDKLLFATIGLLVGIVVMQWTMPTSNANVTVPNSGIMAVEDTDGWLLMLDQNGDAWVVNQGPNWVRYPDYDPPVPANQNKFWQRDKIITIDSHAWIYGFYNGSVQRNDFGPWPGSPVAIQQSTWGKVKAAFGGKH